MSDEAEFFQIAAFDWLVTNGGDRLHAFDSGAFDEDYWGVRNARFACGRRTTLAVIPGIFTRMGAQRCLRCCEVTGLPQGVGSPKNDATCRALLAGTP